MNEDIKNQGLENDQEVAQDNTDQKAEENAANRVIATDDFDYLIGENGFAIQQDEAYEDDTKPVKKSKEKKAKRRNGAAKSLKTIIWIIVIFVVSVSLAFSIIVFTSEFLGIGFGKGGKCVVEIEKGMSTSQIATELKEQGAISSKLLFRVFSRIAGYDGTYQYGVYNFTNELGYGDIAKMLQTEGATAQSIEVTIPEQSSVDDIMKILEEKGVCTKSDFRDAVKNGRYDFDFVAEIPVSEVHYKFEGYLFPDTYEFYNYDSKECAELAIRKMLQNLDSKLTKEVRESIKASGYTIHEILTMASVVELEASAATKEMPKVAAVFFNRLESPDWQGPRRLESDPTMKYPYGNDRYNTYKSEGLPPGPLCAPSENAILASVYPEENFTATYFVTDNVMNFYFNNSLSAHQNTINNLKAQGKWYVTKK